MNGSGIVGFHASLGTTHGLSCLSNVKSFPSPKEEGLSLPERKIPEREFKGRSRSFVCDLFGEVDGHWIRDHGHGIFRRLRVLLYAWTYQNLPFISDPVTTVPILNPTLEDSVKQGSPLRFGTVSVPLN